MALDVVEQGMRATLFLIENFSTYQRLSDSVLLAEGVGQADLDDVRARVEDAIPTAHPAAR